MQNPNCDGSGPCMIGEVRVLPIGGSSNGILCERCFNKEIAYRKLRNKELERQNHFALPFWSDLKVYRADIDNHYTEEARHDASMQAVWEANKRESEQS